jgi:hypothetical protein
MTGSGKAKVRDPVSVMATNNPPSIGRTAFPKMSGRVPSFLEKEGRSLIRKITSQ